MQKIVLTGPESTGKTTLAGQLSAHFGTVWVPEFARQYLDALGRPYAQDDLLEIARGQVALEEEMTGQANGLLFFDTGLEVLKIWSEVRYGDCHPWILAQVQQRRADHYLLCLPDLPWAFDPQRENPDDRTVLLELYRRELAALGADFTEVHGQGDGRFQNALEAVKNFIKI
ncbi:MAG: ATP-binding protein [Bacteroidetes bacterium]|nr:ATP-binding protein [Bacteroidota bacterium]